MAHPKMSKKENFVHLTQIKQDLVQNNKEKKSAASYNLKHESKNRHKNKFVLLIKKKFDFLPFFEA